MENRPPFLNPQFNYDFSETTPQSGSQQLSQQYPYNIQQPFGSFNSQMLGDQSQFQSQVQNNQLRSTITKKKKTQSIRKERDPNWAPEEDEALCKSWLRVSEDPITGTDQPRQRLWDRILFDFNRTFGQETERDSSGLRNRWSFLHPKINKYSGFVEMIKRNPYSGSNATDSIGLASQLYHDDQGHVFKWYPCWLILKDTAKWYNFETEKKNAQKKRKTANVDIDGIEDSTNPSTPITTPISANLVDENITLNQQSSELERPIGRKAAKDMGKNKNIDHVKAINLFAEGFGNFIKDQKEISENELRMSNESERMKIEAKQACERMRIEAKQEQERMRMKAKQEQERMRIQAKQEQEKIKLEKEIMVMDPNSVPTEEGRIYIIAQQKAILARLQRSQENDSSGSGDN